MTEKRHEFEAADARGVEDEKRKYERKMKQGQFEEASKEQREAERQDKI